MSVKVVVESSDEAVKVRREATASCVVKYFGNRVPPLKELLCFLDQTDPPELRAKYGPDNRGLYGPIHGRDCAVLEKMPLYVTKRIFAPSSRAFDDLIYLYESTCADEVGLSIILAHELQHAIQHASVPKLWAVNGLVPDLDRKIIDALRLTWGDIPTEREARIVSKGVGMHLFGEQRVLQYIDEKITERVTEADEADWRFVRTLSSSSSVDLDAETKQFFRRLRGHRAELEAILQERRRTNDPDFLDVDLNAYF